MNPDLSLFQRYSLALRLPFMGVSLIACLAAGALAWHDGRFALIPFVLATVAVLLAHSATNLANDYFDFKAGNFPKQKTGSTGGSFAIQSGLFSEGKILGLAVFAFLASVAIFAWLSTYTSIVVFVLGLVGNLIGFFYTAPPLKFGYRHLGEILTFLGMGPLLFASVYYAQAGTITSAGLVLSVFLGLLISNILLAAQIPDISEDKATGKLTISSTSGPGATAKTFLVSAIVGGLGLIAAIFIYGLPIWCLFGLVGTIMTYLSYDKMSKGDIAGALLGSIYAMEIGGLLLAVTLLF